MRYFLTYRLPFAELAADQAFRAKLLGTSHWFELKEIEEHDEDGNTTDNDTQITISVDERTASYISLKLPYRIVEKRPNFGL